MTRALVEKNIDLSRKRMGVDSLDLLQFHWWEYQDKNYLDALKFLSELQDEGKIKHLALTNFDTQHLKIIIDSGIQIVSNQVQFSLVDRRPEVQMIQFCQEHNIQLLAYGTLCGSLLSEKYLGLSEPQRAKLDTASLRKYKNMVDTWGGWSLFQELLLVLQQIAQKYAVSIPNVAVRYILDQPAVAGAIVGARLGISEHWSNNTKVFSFKLDPEDQDWINAVLMKSRDLYQLIGDCGDEYRR
jgi:aryl-alcohol dehydrogenase-like predicted oxidoreductase